MRAFTGLCGLGLICILFECGGTTGGSDASVDGPGGGSCANVTCMAGRTCCNGKCINTDNDPQNCGTCGTKCGGSTPYCDTTCKALPACMTDGGACGPNFSCCGSNCCGPGQLCCKDNGPVSAGPVCFTTTSEQPTCPQGCMPLCQSDRNIKQDIVPVESRVVLETLAGVPISTWSYKDDPKTRHMGPMAQDLHAAFALGSTDKAYNPVDAHGIEMASIQALYEMVRNQNERIERLEKENATLSRRCSP